MERGGLRWVLLAFAVLVFSGCHTAPRVQLTVSAAASLAGTLEQVESRYQATHREIEFRNNFGSSGMLAQQIEQGAPVDVFFSAASGPMNELVRKGLVAEGDGRVVLRNRLALIVPRDSKMAAIEDLTLPEVRKIAVGDPASVPAGHYALQTLQAVGLAKAVKARMVLTKDVRQVLAYVEWSNADAGFVYATDARLSPAVRIAWIAPEGTHDPIEYPAAALVRSPHRKEAEEFTQYLASPAARAEFAAKGFQVPGQ